MKIKRLAVLILTGAIIGNGLSVQAATINDRIDALEAAAGVAQGSALAERLEYLEEQFGIRPDDGSTITDRIAALEHYLGLTTNDANADAGNGDNSVTSQDQDSGTTGSAQASGGTSTAEQTSGSYDNADFGNELALKELDYYTMDNLRLDPGDYMLKDNYGGMYAYGITSRDIDPGTVEYRLDGQYSELSGTIYVAAYALQNGSDFQWHKAKFSVYADDKLIYRAEDFNEKSEPKKFLLDIRGTQYLKIKLEGNYCYDMMPMPILVLGDPILDPAGGPASDPSYDNGVYRDEMSLRDMDYFERDNIAQELTDYNYEDNYGEKYAYAMTNLRGDPGSIEFLTNGEYTEFDGTLYVSGYAAKNGHDFQWVQTRFSVYGDDKLLFMVDGANLDERSHPIAFSLDITGMKFLKIQFDGNYCYDFSVMPMLILGDPMLYK